MNKINKYKKHMNFSRTIAGLCLPVFVAGVIIFIWFGIAGVKIMSTSLTLMIFFYFYAKGAEERVAEITKEESKDRNSKWFD